MTNNQRAWTNIKANNAFEAVCVLILDSHFKSPVRKATREENKYKHTDAVLETLTQVYNIDIKLPKKQSRRSASYIDAMWVEIKNRYGYDGWLVCEDLNLICQISLDLSKAYIISRKMLNKLVLAKIADKPLMTYNTGIDYTPYQRPGNLDVICTVPWCDVEKCIKMTIDFRPSEISQLKQAMEIYNNNSI